MSERESPSARGYNEQRGNGRRVPSSDVPLGICRSTKLAHERGHRITSWRSSPGLHEPPNADPPHGHFPNGKGMSGRSSALITGGPSGAPSRRAPRGMDPPPADAEIRGADSGRRLRCEPTSGSKKGKTQTKAWRDAPARYSTSGGESHAANRPLPSTGGIEVPKITAADPAGIGEAGENRLWRGFVRCRSDCLEAGCCCAGREEFPFGGKACTFRRHLAGCHATLATVKAAAGDDESMDGVRRDRDDVPLVQDESGFPGEIDPLLMD